MTTQQLENVIFWLEKRKHTFTDANRTKAFVRKPDSVDAVQATQDLFNRFLYEATNEHKLSIQYGGQIADSLPVICLSSPLL